MAYGFLGTTYAGVTLAWTYDNFGNRKSQTASGTYTAPVPQPAAVTFNSNKNRVDQWSYDTAGDVSNDGTNMYEYDAEGRQTGTLNSLTGLTGYVYDAEGRRAMKVVVNGFGGPNPTTTVQNEYLLGLNGEQAGGPFKPCFGLSGKVPASISVDDRLVL